MSKKEDSSPLHRAPAAMPGSEVSFPSLKSTGCSSPNSLWDGCWKKKPSDPKVTFMADVQRTGELSAFLPAELPSSK